jgi:hypothetical protein
MDGTSNTKSITKIESEPNEQENSEHNDDLGKGIKLAAIVFIAGNGVIGTARFVAGDFDKPTVFWINGVAIALSVIVTGVSIWEIAPKLKHVIGLVCFALAFIDLVWSAALIENYQPARAQISAARPERLNLLPTLEQPTFHEKSEMVRFTLGGFGVVQSVANLENPKNLDRPFDLNGFSPVTLSVVEDKLFVDFTTWDGPDKPSVEVKGNEFIVRPEGWDRNSSANALEVVNNQGQAVFQLIRRSPTDVVINGLFLFPNGIRWAANYPRTVVNPTPARLAEFLPKPIFKYPAWKYPGKYADDSN